MRSVILSCEHGGNDVPPSYAHIFDGNKSVLNTHRGWDPGALPLAEFLAGRWNVPLFFLTTTRLLIEANRSPESPELFSEFSSQLSAREKQSILLDIYQPYRSKIEAYIAKHQPVTHLSVHTFTPVWHGTERSVDIGLLFDPARSSEASLCRQWKIKLDQMLPGFSIRFNEPYLGIDDGLTTYLRKRFGDELYTGIEVEVNQKFISTSQMEIVQNALATLLGH